MEGNGERGKGYWQRETMNERKGRGKGGKGEGGGKGRGGEFASLALGEIDAPAKSWQLCPRVQVGIVHKCVTSTSPRRYAIY